LDLSRRRLDVCLVCDAGEVLAELSWRDLVPAIWLPDPGVRRVRELAR